MADESCPICEVNPTRQLDASIPWRAFNCPNCGHFAISDDMLIDLPGVIGGKRRVRAVLSYAIRRMQSSKPLLLPDSRVLEILKADDLPTPSEQVDLMLIEVGDMQGSPGQKAEIFLDKVRAKVGTDSLQGATWCISSLTKEALATSDPAGPKVYVSLTLAGWRRYEEIRKGRSVSRRAFMAMKYRDPELDLLYEATLKPAVARTGFTLVRLDEDPPAGMIDVRLRAEIRRARFLIADLTHANAGAYWEAGFMEGLGRPVIYMCREDVFKKDGTHFDTNHSHHVVWSVGSEEKCARELVATVRATLPSEAQMEDPA